MRKNKILRNIAILVLPFFLMIVVNEIIRPTITGKPYTKYGISAINSVDKTPEKCTWICHNNTTYCKTHHVKYLKSYFQFTDKMYFGIIHLLKKTGNYRLANIIFLVILFPFLIWFFTIKSLNIQDEINKLKNQKNE